MYAAAGIQTTAPAMLWTELEHPLLSGNSILEPRVSLPPARLALAGAGVRPPVRPAAFALLDAPPSGGL